MLVGRDNLHPRWSINLLMDARRDIHGKRVSSRRPANSLDQRGSTCPSSADADRHKRFWRDVPTITCRFKPLRSSNAPWLSRLIAAILFPLFSYSCRSFCAGASARGSIAGTANSPCSSARSRRAPGRHPIERWMADLDRIERAVAGIYIAD